MLALKALLKYRQKFVKLKGAGTAVLYLDGQQVQSIPFTEKDIMDVEFNFTKVVNQKMAESALKEHDLTLKIENTGPDAELKL